MPPYGVHAYVLFVMLELCGLCTRANTVAEHATCKDLAWWVFATPGGWARAIELFLGV
jgi:hypothetical protein